MPDKINHQFLDFIESENIIGANESLSKGASINFNNPEQLNALLIATNNQDIKALQFLVEKNIEINLNIEGYSAAHSASALGNLQILKFLVKYKIDLELQNSSDGRYCIHWACQELHINIIKYLINQKVNINVKDNEGITPLDIVCSEGDVKISEFLISKNANVNARRNDGITPLHMAVAFNQYNIVQILLKNGADPFLKDYDDEKNSFDYAKENESYEILKILKNYT